MFGKKNPGHDSNSWKSLTKFCSSAILDKQLITTDIIITITNRDNNIEFKMDRNVFSKNTCTLVPNTWFPLCVSTSETTLLASKRSSNRLQSAGAQELIKVIMFYLILNTPLLIAFNLNKQKFVWLHSCDSSCINTCSTKDFNPQQCLKTMIENCWIGKYAAAFLTW